MPKKLVHEDVYEIHNDVSSLYHKSHHYSKAILRCLNGLKKVRFSNSPPEIFEYEIWDSEDSYGCNSQNFDIDGKIIDSTESCDYYDEIYDHSQENTNYQPENNDNQLLLPIISRKEIFRNENSIETFDEDSIDYVPNKFSTGKLKEILSIDGKYIQKKSKIDKEDTEDNNWIDLKELNIEIEKLSTSEKETVEIIKDHSQSQLRDSNFVDMQSTTESLNFL